MLQSNKRLEPRLGLPENRGTRESQPFVSIGMKTQRASITRIVYNEKPASLPGNEDKFSVVTVIFISRHFMSLPVGVLIAVLLSKVSR